MNLWRSYFRKDGDNNRRVSGFTIFFFFFFFHFPTQILTPNSYIGEKGPGGPRRIYLNFR